MTSAIDNLVRQFTTGTGIGNLTLTTVAGGYQTFNGAFGNGASTNVFYYFIFHQTATEWEIGTGHMSDATTLVRDTVLKSSNSNAAVSFSAGTKNVDCDIPSVTQTLLITATSSNTASTLVQRDSSGNFAVGTITMATQPAGDNSSKGATTSYADTSSANAAAAINAGIQVDSATTASGNTSGWTYNNGVGGIGATFTGPVNTAITIDGVLYNNPNNQKLLVKNDTQSPSGAFNGIFLFTAAQTVGTGAVFTRPLDYDQSSDINNVGVISVTFGTANGGAGFILTTKVTNVGVDPLTYQIYNPPYAVIVKTTDTATVTNTMLSTMAANTVKVNATAGAAAPTDMALSASQLAGRGSTGNVAPIAIGPGLTMTGTTLDVTPPTVFTSSDQTITAAGSLTLAHGLSARPNHVHVLLINETAENGYSIGDILVLAYGGNLANNQGISVVVDATNINVRFGSAATLYNIVRKDTGATANITNANWKIRFLATTDL